MKTLIKQVVITLMVAYITFDMVMLFNGNDINAMAICIGVLAFGTLRAWSNYDKEVNQ